MGVSRGSGPAGNGRPGPVFDTAMRRLVEADPARACRLIRVPVTQQPEILPASFPAGTLSADLLLRVAPDRLAHVEYMRSASGDLVARMLIYRGLIMRAHPAERVSQHVIVLGGGRVQGHDDLPGRGFALDLGVVYLCELDPASFLDGPSLAPLAVLGRGGVRDRSAAFAAAIRVIRTEGGNRTRELMEFAQVLATIRLDTPTIEEIVKEAGMTVESIAGLFRETEFGQLLVNEGRTEGRNEGRTEGRTEGREALLTALLRDRFGDQPGLAAAAHRLAGWPDAAAALHAVTAAADLDNLPEAPPAT